MHPNRSLPGCAYFPSLRRRCGTGTAQVYDGSVWHAKMDGPRACISRAQGIPKALVQYTQMVDVYAFAITMFEICTHSPLGKKPRLRTRCLPKLSLIRGPLSMETSKPSCQLGGWSLHVCWDRQPNLRPTFNEICNRLRTMCRLVKDRKAMGQESLISQ